MGVEEDLRPGLTLARAASVHRELRTGKPVWLRRGDVHVPSAPLAEDLSVDVAIVGAGVSGALVADALLDCGKTVAVLDRLLQTPGPRRRQRGECAIESRHGVRPPFRRPPAGVEDALRPGLIGCPAGSAGTRSVGASGAAGWATSSSR